MRLGRASMLLWAAALTPACGSDSGGAAGDGGLRVDAAAGTGGDAGLPLHGGAHDAGMAPEINPGFVGGSCGGDEECDYLGGFCLRDGTQADDADDAAGVCSLDCERFCPDRSGAATTFCVEPAALGGEADEGLCTVHCDFGRSPTGCGALGGCAALPRFGEPEARAYVCAQDGGEPFEPSDCHRTLLELGIGFRPALLPPEMPDEVDATCEVQDAVWIEPVLHGVSFRWVDAETPTPIFAACELALALERTAAIAAGQGIEEIVHLGTYACRAIADSNVLSEHGRGTAIDIAALQLATGERYGVLEDWEPNEAAPTTAGGAALHDFIHALGDANVFNVILTPDYDPAHADHFHCDLSPDTSFFQ